MQTDLKQGAANGIGMPAHPDTNTAHAMESADWNRRYASENFIWSVDASRFVKDEVADLLPGRALDLAAGEGRNAVWLADQGWQVRAVDFAAVGIDKGQGLAQARGVADRIVFEVADLRDYAMPAKHYELVLLAYLHMPEHELMPILARAAKAVAPGGTLLLIGHDANNLLHGYGGPRHAELLYSAEQVAAALGSKFEIEKAGRFERPVHTDDGVKIALDCQVRAKRLVGSCVCSGRCTPPSIGA